jgi:hypothetical protein
MIVANPTCQNLMDLLRSAHFISLNTKTSILTSFLFHIANSSR